MKKTPAFLLVGATCIILLGGLWAAGLLHFPKAEKEPTPDSPKQAEKQTEQKKPQELIVGKWECQAGGLFEGAGKEFTANGAVTDYNWQGPKQKTYKFVNDTSIEYEWPDGKGNKKETCQIQVEKEWLVETYGEQGISFVLRYKRVQEFPADFAKSSQKTIDKDATASKPATAKAVLTFRKHEASVEAVAISPDGTLIASGADDGIVLIWERATGTLKHKLDTLQGRKEANRNEGVRSIAFSPDGSTVASSSSGNVILWNVETGERRKDFVFAGSQGTFSPDGKLLITVTYDQVHVWDLVENKNVFTKKAPGSISSIAVSPDGKLIASGDLASYVKVWDAKSGEQAFSYKDSRGQIFSVAFSPDSSVLAAESGGLYLNLFDLKTGDTIPLKGQIAKKSFSRPLFLLDGKNLLCGTSKEEVFRVWDLSTGHERLIFKGHSDPIKALAVSPDGRYLASASQDHTVKTWDVSSVVDPPIKLIRPQFDKYVFKRRNAIMKVADLSLSNITGQELGGRSAWFRAISPNEKYVVTVEDGGSRLKVWDIETKKMLTEGTCGYSNVAFSRDSQLFAYCASDGVKLVSLPTGNERCILPNPTFKINDENVPKDGKQYKYSFRYSQVTFSRDGTKAAACGRYDGYSPSFSFSGGVVIVWDTTKGDIVRTIIDDFRSGQGFTHLAFGDQDKIAYSTEPDPLYLKTWNQEVRIWKFSSGHQEHVLRTQMHINRLTWNETGSLLAIAGSGRTLLWDAQKKQGTYLLAEADFLKASDMMVSVDSKGVRVVDAAHGFPIFKLHEGDDLSSVSSTGDGNRLALITSSQVTLWKMDKEILDLVKQERLSTSPNGKAKVLEIKDGFVTPQDGFWIDSTPLWGQESRLVIAIHKGTSFNQPIKLKVSSEDKRLVFSPESHEIKEGDTKTKEVVFLVRDLGETERNCMISVTTDPPSNVLRRYFAVTAKAPSEKKKDEKEKEEVWTDAKLKTLSDQTNLASLHLKYSQVTDAGMKELANLKNLSVLDLEWTRVTDSGLKEIAHLDKLSSLRLNNTKVTDAGLKEFAKFTNLSDLGLFGTKITDAGLKEIAHLDKLSSLNLGNTKITDEGLKEIANLKNLSTLVLYKTKVTDTGLKELTNLKKLSSLWLRKTQVTDAGLKEIGNLKNLTFLDLNEHHTDMAVQELQKALPRCRIERDQSKKKDDKEKKGT